MELPLPFGTIQLAIERLCRLSCVFNAAYVEESLIGVFSRFRAGFSIVMFAAVRSGI